MKDDDLLNKFSEERKKERNNNLINKLINKSLIIKSFSVTKPDFHNFAAFMEISEREDPNFTCTIMKAIREYVRAHHIPNPQSTLPRSLELGLKAKSKHVCCVGDCRGKARFLLTLRNFEGKQEQFQVCRAHKRWRHPHFKAVIRVSPIR